jgi:hypothetical protein
MNHAIRPQSKTPWYHPTAGSSAAKWLLLPLLCLGTASTVVAREKDGTNYDEAAANLLPIPDVLTAEDGRKITTREEWVEKRRPELLGLFSREVYGKTPEAKVPVRAVTVSAGKSVHGGKGIMSQTALLLGAEGEVKADLLCYLPTAAKEKPVPVFVILNFWGNHSVEQDPDIHISQGWFRENKMRGIVDHRATAASRGTSAESFPIREILERGYGLATVYYGDFDPDFDDGFKNGIHPLFEHRGQSERAGDAWGSIGAWAWGLGRIADHLVGLPGVDGTKLAVVGHSRLGKAALWAGAQDDRFSIVISNNSGEGGAALSKRDFGETVSRITTSFPHWFCGNYRRYANNESLLAMDQHALISLMAPRPVYVTSATEDRWADPKGEFLSASLAGPVYGLFGKEGVGSAGQPAPQTPVGGSIGYHLRDGAHALLRYDWERFMDFADRHWEHGGEPR